MREGHHRITSYFRSTIPVKRAEGSIAETRARPLPRWASVRPYNRSAMNSASVRQRSVEFRAKVRVGV